MLGLLLTVMTFPLTWCSLVTLQPPELAERLLTSVPIPWPLSNSHGGLYWFYNQHFSPYQSLAKNGFINS